jgi:hypothetical protein
MKRSTMLRVSRLLLVACLLATANGCAYLSRVRFTVEESSLDYVQFRQVKDAEGGPSPIVNCLELSGSGYLEYRTGRSERVRDGFWQESTSPHLEDLHSDHLVLSQEETVAICQRLVDAGFFDGKQKQESDENAPKIIILARIGFEKRVIVTASAVYVDIFEELMLKFRR